MKHLLPVLIFLLLVGSVFAIYKYKESTDPADAEVQQISKVDEIPTGDPDETVDTIVDSAVAEAGDSAGEDGAELDDITADITEASAIGDVYSENEY